MLQSQSGKKRSQVEGGSQEKGKKKKKKKKKKPGLGSTGKNLTYCGTWKRLHLGNDRRLNSTVQEIIRFLLKASRNRILRQTKIFQDEDKTINYRATNSRRTKQKTTSDGEVTPRVGLQLGLPESRSLAGTN